jgi:exosortase/archaeosortase family protein
MAKPLFLIDTKRLFLFSIIAASLALILNLVFILTNVYTPLSDALNSPNYISAILNEFVPIAFMIGILFYLKMSQIKLETVRRYSALETVSIIAVVVSCILVVFRSMDIVMMRGFATYSQGPMRGFTQVSFHILFYYVFCLSIFTITAFFVNKKDLKLFIPVLIIPAFYSLNADILLKAPQYNALSFFAPFYQFVLAFGKIETMIVGSLLNLINFRAIIYTNSFPFRLLMGSAFYLIDLPCIGWEGLMGYSIIFLNLLMDFEDNNKMRLFWGVLGFVGTILANIFRLSLILIMGELFDVQVAKLIHEHGGDIIFVIWIFVFIFIIHSYKQGKFTWIFDRLRSLLTLP